MGTGMGTPRDRSSMKRMAILCMIKGKNNRRARARVNKRKPKTSNNPPIAC